MSCITLHLLIWMKIKYIKSISRIVSQSVLIKCKVVVVVVGWVCDKDVFIDLFLQCKVENP